MKFLLFLLTASILNEIINGWSESSDMSSTETDESSESNEFLLASGEYSDGELVGYLFRNKLEAVNSDPISKDTLDSYYGELAAGHPSDLFGTNNHYYQPNEYKDFGRRFILQYPYTDKMNLKDKQKEEDKLIPKRAPPEVVMAVAKESALLEASKPVNPYEHVIDAKVLRNRDYWNGVWREDVDPESILRSKRLNKHKLSTFKVKIMPGSDLYELISKLKIISPRLLYVINKE